MADRALRDGSRDRDPTHGEQLVQVKLQPDAEHQENHADLRQLLGERAVRDEARRVWTDQDPGEQVADDRRQADALRDEAQDQRRAETASECEDQIVVVHS